jgi:hypothetical protein
MSHPFTGVPIPFRVQYEVTSAGPSGQLDVPADAFLWDAETGKYSSVAAGEKAISKVTLDFSDYFSSNWHHGQPITMADVLYSIYQSYDMVYNEDKANIEFTIATTNKPVLDTFRGFRVLDDNTLEVLCSSDITLYTLGNSSGYGRDCLYQTTGCLHRYSSGTLLCVLAQPCHGRRRQAG